MGNLLFKVNGTIIGNMQGLRQDRRLYRLKEFLLKASSVQDNNPLYLLSHSCPVKVREVEMLSILMVMETT